MADAPIIKWETRPWTDVIRRVECERESGSSLWVIDEWLFGERKARILRKNSGRWTFHDTWEDAQSHLMERALALSTHCARPDFAGPAALGTGAAMRCPRVFRNCRRQRHD